MGVGHLAPHQIRAKYAKALAEIPLPIRGLARIDPAALTVLADTTIAGRRLQFGVLFGQPRLWVAFSETDPPLIGYLTGFDTAEPRLHITELDHLQWARTPGRSALIEREAQAVWQAAQRECEG